MCCACSSLGLARFCLLQLSRSLTCLSLCAFCSCLWLLLQFFYGAEAETDRAKVKAADYDAKNPAGSYTFVFKH